VQVLFLGLLGLVGVAGQAHRDWVGLHEARSFAGVRVMAIGAITLGSRVLNLCRGDLLRLIVVAHHAQGLHILLRQHYLPFFGRLMAGVALLTLKGVVQERLHQLGRLGLVRVVALKAVGFVDGLIPVRLDHRRIFHIVTVETQSGRGFGQVIREFALCGIACLVSDVAGVATHVERRVTAASLGGVHAHAVTGQAEVLVLRSTRSGLQ